MQGSPAKTCLQQLVKGELEFGPLIACAAKGVLLRAVTVILTCNHSCDDTAQICRPLQAL